MPWTNTNILKVVRILAYKQLFMKYVCLQIRIFTQSIYICFIERLQTSDSFFYVVLKEYFLFQM